jgi:rhodanese-related sulfurtransferase
MNDQIKHYREKLNYELDSSDLFDAINNNETIVIVDTRKSFAFDEEHIPYAINLPHREMNAETTKHLDRNTTFITYCDGIGCNASTKGAFKLVSLGFKVKELIGGLDWWKRDGYETHGSNSKKGIKLNCAC